MGEAAKKTKSQSYLKIVDGTTSKAKRINADGTIDQRHKNVSNKRAGVSSKVYFLNREEIELMKNAFIKNIESSCEPTNELMNRRNYALFCMGINVGLRISDLIKFKWCDIFDKHWQLKDMISIKPKKTERFNKYVTIVFNDSFKNAVQEYKNEVTRLRDLPDMEDYIFWGKMYSNVPIQEKSVCAIMKKTAEEAGIKKNVGTHSLRKTFGRNFYMENKDRAYALRMLQECFGHESPYTTLTYIGVTLEEQVNFYNSVNL